VWLTDSEFGILAYARTTTSSVPTTISATLPSTKSAKLYIVIRDKDARRGETFTTSLGGPPLMTFATSRILQSDIDNGLIDADHVFAVGDFLFGDHDYTIDDGLGNALSPPLGGPNPRPNSRKIHNGKFGGPDATTCHECHDQGGSDGAGDFAHNLLQDGDGVNLSSTLPRNPPQVIGVGYLQQLGIEMTADLQAQLATAKQTAAGQTAPVTVNFTTKGVSYGSAVVNSDGTVDFTGLQGVDSDLVVKPLGWKGRVANARRFVEGGFQVHLGMASQALIAKHCKTPIPGTVGDGPDCTDPDNDGVRDEITEGQLTGMALYATLLQVPQRVPAKGNSAKARATAGEALFNQLGCTGCHIQNLTLNSSIHTELPDLSGGKGITVDLTVDGRKPQLSKNTDGTVTVELWSDLKRHDMGDSLADSHATFGTFSPRQYLTPPLWGVAATAPYLHDGRASTLSDAIAQHDGEGAAARDAFLALSQSDQNKLVEFLGTLGRNPQHSDD
jgi:hypothetical protein